MGDEFLDKEPRHGFYTATLKGGEEKTLFYDKYTGMITTRDFLFNLPERPESLLDLLVLITKMIPDAMTITWKN